MKFLIVFLGSGIGGALRLGVYELTGGLSLAFPYGTLFINIVGSFLIGILAEYFVMRGQMSHEWRLFLTTGILGGFTTFSAFSLETGLLYERGAHVAAALYIIGSVGLGLCALFAGLALARYVLAA